eukprot:snap_masked-scaffold_3-processed-gene-1.3-mRNA-1 protein AED:1.00 eAED:1.00 QI:0/0/0/0/1/1/2/0/88
MSAAPYSIKGLDPSDNQIFKVDKLNITEQVWGKSIFKSSSYEAQLDLHLISDSIKQFGRKSITQYLLKANLIRGTPLIQMRRIFIEYI